MKRKIILYGGVMVGTALVLFLLCTVTIFIYQNTWGYHPDETIVSKMKNDTETPEFLLYDIYYQLPTDLSAFTSEGWKPKYEKEHVNADTCLKPGEYVTVRYKKRGNAISLTVLNQTKTVMKISDPQIAVVGIEVRKSELINKRIFITKQGIHLYTDSAETYRLLRGNVKSDRILWSIEWYTMYNMQEVPVLYFCYDCIVWMDRQIKIYSVKLEEFENYLKN